MLKDANNRQRIVRAKNCLAEPLLNEDGVIAENNKNEVIHFLEDFYQKYENYDSSKNKIDIVFGVMNVVGIFSVLGFIGFLVYLSQG